MADLQKLLGTMLSSGLAGKGGRGAGLASSLGGGRGGGANFKQVAGLAGLAYMAYKAFQERAANQQASGQQGGDGMAGGSATPASTGGLGGLAGSLGDRLSSILRPPPALPPATEQAAAREAAALGDSRAMLLIRAMISAANSDGKIDDSERRSIMARLDSAGAGAEEREIVERELASPQSMDALVRAVSDQETAEQVYMASLIAIDGDTSSEQHYLQYLASRLNIAPDRVRELQTAVQG